jgi:hypothetical protein
MKNSWLWRASMCLGWAALFWTGCIPSLQPFYTEKDLLFESALVGAFSEQDDSSVWTFTKSSEKEYRLVIKDKANSSSFSARLFKLADDLYLDLYPAKNSLDDCPREDFFKSSLVPGHLCLRLPQIQPSLRLQVMDEEGLKESLKSNPGVVPHSFIEDERLVFTGSTEQMQAFLRKIQKNEKAWGKPVEFTRRNVGK